MKRKHYRFAAAAAALLVVAGCQGPSDAYVAADRATFDALAPDYIHYVTQDQSLNDDSRNRKLRTIATWQARLRAAEAAR